MASRALLSLLLLLGACAGHHRQSDASGEDEGVNAYPANYKTDILAGMHAYLNDPTAIRDASISEPAMKSESAFSHQRYMVCLRFNPKKTATVYEGMREVAAVFIGGSLSNTDGRPSGSA